MLKLVLNYPKTFVKRYSQGIWLITFVGFLNSISVSISLPFLALYLYEKRGISMSMVGVIMLISGTFSAVAQLFAGAIADRLGRRPLLLMTIIMGILLYSGMAVLIGIDAPVLSIILFYVVVRAALMMQRPAIQAIVVDLTPPGRLTESFSLQRIGGNLGWAAGPAIGGFMAGTLTYAWLFGLAGLIGIFNIVLIFFFFRESFGRASEKVKIGSIFKAALDKNLLIFTILCLLVFIVSGQMSSTLSVYSVEHAGFSTSQYGFLLTLNGLIIVVFQYPITFILGHLASHFSLVLGAFLYGVGYLILTWVGPYSLAIGSMVLITAGEIVFAPTTSAVVGEMSSTNWRGRYMGFFGLSETMGMAIGPLIGGVLLDAFPLQPLFVWGAPAILAFAAATGFNQFGRKQKNPSK
jgi:MFS family permease